MEIGDIKIDDIVLFVKNENGSFSPLAISQSQGNIINNMISTLSSEEPFSKLKNIEFVENKDNNQTNDSLINVVNIDIMKEESYYQGVITVFQHLINIGKITEICDIIRSNSLDINLLRKTIAKMPFTLDDDLLTVFDDVENSDKKQYKKR